MFMSENICALVDLCDKAVAEGRVMTVETRSQDDDGHRNIEYVSHDFDT